MLYLELAGSLVLLLLGGETLVRGAVATATRAGVFALLIGLTLVGFGTSTPELLTSLEAAIVGAPGIAVGNVVGSNAGPIYLKTADRHRAAVADRHWARALCVKDAFSRRYDARDFRTLRLHRPAGRAGAEAAGICPS